MMKKWIAALAVLLLALPFGAGADGSGNSEVPSAGMPNPWSECSSLEELNEAAGTNLQLPGVMGVSDVAYRLMKSGDRTIAEVDFQVNGTEYVLRGSPDYAEDISGVYLSDGKTAFEGRDEECPAYAEADSMLLSRWMDVNAQYVLMIRDKANTDDETFRSITEEMMEMTNPFHPVVLIEGDYQDEVSRRACATVKASGENTYAIEIHWADSASEDNVWTMTARMTEDGLLSYQDCIEKKVITADNGTVKEFDADIIPEGFFVPLDEGTFDWSGAADVGCRSCVFKATEN